MEEKYYAIILMFVILFKSIAMFIMYLCCVCDIKKLQREKQTLQYNMNIMKEKLQTLEELERQNHLT